MFLTVICKVYKSSDHSKHRLWEDRSFDLKGYPNISIVWIVLIIKEISQIQREKRDENRRTTSGSSDRRYLVVEHHQRVYKYKYWRLLHSNDRASQLCVNSRPPFASRWLSIAPLCYSIYMSKHFRRAASTSLIPSSLFLSPSGPLILRALLSSNTSALPHSPLNHQHPSSSFCPLALVSHSFHPPVPTQASSLQHFHGRPGGDIQKDRNNYEKCTYDKNEASCGTMLKKHCIKHFKLHQEFSLNFFFLASLASKNV